MSSFGSIELISSKGIFNDLLKINYFFSIHFNYLPFNQLITDEQNEIYAFSFSFFKTCF